MKIRLDDIEVTPRQIAQAASLLEDCSVHMDANETALFARQLEYVKAQTYDIQFGKLKALQFIPVDTSANEAAESIVYRQWEEVESATVITNMADDLPQADVLAREFTSPVASIGASYTWSIQDIRRAAMAGEQIDLRRARSARLSIDRRIDQIGAGGIPEIGTTGFYNNASVPGYTFPTAGAWDAITTLQVLDNLNGIAQSIVDATGEVEVPNTLVLPTTEFGIIAQRPMSVDNSKTILKTFLENSPYITQVDQWARLNTAGASSAPRCVCYDRNDRVLTFNIPLLFEQIPPQARNLSFVVNCHARVGIVEFHYPKACAYGDRV